MSLRSRIRGGQDYFTVKVATAAQFLTLRLIPIGSTHVGCDDSDVPGHAPRYLDVGPSVHPRGDGSAFLTVDMLVRRGQRARGSIAVLSSHARHRPDATERGRDVGRGQLLPVKTLYRMC